MNSKIIDLFSTKSVKEKIIEGTLSEGEIFFFFYFVFMFNVFGVTEEFLSLIESQVTLLDRVNIWGYFIVTGLGILILFVVNGGSKGKDFISKFFAFTFTVGYKYEIALGILDAVAFFISPAVTSIYQITVYLVLNLLMIMNIAFRIYQTRKAAC